MNSNIIPVGLTETVTNGTVTKALLVEAETDLVISAITYKFPPTTANAGAVTAFTLKAGRHLFNVDSITFTGTTTVTYRTTAN